MAKLFVEAGTKPASSFTFDFFTHAGMTFRRLNVIIGANEPFGTLITMAYGLEGMFEKSPIAEGEALLTPHHSKAIGLYLVIALVKHIVIINEYTRIVHTYCKLQ